MSAANTKLRITPSEAFVETLAAYGVKDVFGIVGSAYMDPFRDAKTLVTHPATTTHQRLKPEIRAELGIGEGFIRYSAGIEHQDDLIEDALAALEKAYHDRGLQTVSVAVGAIIVFVKARAAVADKTIFFISSSYVGSGHPTV